LTTDTTNAPTTSRQRLAQVGPIALGASAWLAGLAADGLIASRTDPIILPAPFWPTNPVTRPVATSKVASSTATRVP
jgi:hypothetical protein